ncbi:MAG TPA: glycosyltransferase family 4 protein [bacterium]|nr:glycosyltransferase family 4 protein [bacterium]HPN45612.1 glycosyltransferase family 4 protein [bacterium]
MHIVYIHQYFSTPEGGSGIRSYEWAIKLVAAGHKVTMISSAKSNTKMDQRLLYQKGKREIIIDGITVKLIKAPYSNNMNLWQRTIAFFRFAFGTYSRILESRPDLIFATSTPLTVGLPAKSAAKKLKVPFVFEVRDLWPELIFALGAMKNPLARWFLINMEHSIYRAAQHIIALAPGIKDGIKRAGYPEEQISIIPNCSDLDLFMPKPTGAPEPNYGKPGDVRFVFTGAHGRANGLDAVLDGIAELKKRHKHGMHFIFIGTGSQKERLVKRSVDEGLTDYITWVDRVVKTELAELLPRFDVGMMILANIPEFYYGTSPNKFFDYISSGIPVLNNYPGWLADMITANKCGLVCKPDDPVEFADTVEKFCADKQMREAMGLASRKLAEKEFSRDRLGDEFVHVLEKNKR